VTGEVEAILVLVVVHIVAVAFLIWLMLDGDRGSWRGWWPRDDGPDDPRPEPPSPGGGGLPLRDAVQSAMRFREPGRLADRYPAQRRPSHAPQPGRTRRPA